MFKKLVNFVILLGVFQSAQGASLPDRSNTSNDELLAKIVSGTSGNMTYDAFMKLYNISSGNIRTISMPNDDIALAKALSASLVDSKPKVNNNSEIDLAKAISASLVESNKPRVKKDDRLETEIAMAISMHDLKLSEEEREEALLENFRKAKAKKVAKKPEVQKKECVICQTEIDRPQLISCGHNEFHSDCIKKWIASSLDRNGKATCPICRKDIV